MPPARVTRIVDAGLFWLGGAMCLSFIDTNFSFSLSGVLVVAVASALVTAMRLAAGAASSGRRAIRALGRLAWVGNAAFHGLVCYLALVWGSKLAWTMSWWSTGLAVLLFVAALATLWRPFHRIRVPIALPIGVVIMTCLLGWQGEEGYARCDDYRRVGQQRDVEVLFPPVDQLAGCSPGAVFPIGRYPRKLWESSDGRRYVVTTTITSGPQSVVGPDADVYDGLFCEVSADGSGRPHCVGGVEGKAHQIEEIAPLDQLFSCAWGVSDGRRFSTVYRLSRSAPLTVLGQYRINDAFIVYGFYQPKTDEYHAFSDQYEPIRTLRGSDFSVLPDLPVETNSPGATVYDAEHDEGVMCGGRDGFAAFRVMPWSYRFIATSGNPTSRVWMSWGCDFDRTGRKVYTTVANLGLLAVIDYDTGRVERTHFVGFALRSVAFDAPRQRVYLADFLGGEVLAVDATSGAEVKRWFVGHYIRDLRISNDGRKLLTTSNLGIGRIDLAAR